MKQSTMKWMTLVLTLAAIMTLGACHKKAAPPPPPPPPPPPAPTASLTANPSTIQQGQSTTLTWQTGNATNVTIDQGVGPVEANGSKSVSPTESTTYTLTATGASGTQPASATARVTVTPPPPPPAPAPAPSDEQQFASAIHDIYFDYDKYDVRADQAATLQADAQWLAAHPNVRFTIEGHCDERGSTEYNIVLGQNRADAVKNSLAQAGVVADRIKTVSYGKEKPFCTESNEQCWQQNRRGHFVYGQQ